MEFNMEEIEFYKYLDQQARKIDIMLSEEQLQKFYKYMKLLLEWNEKINLTAIIEPKEIILKHFIDSLSIIKYIKNKNSLVDVGTGAGFPGIPIKIVLPEIKVILIDSLNKRITFLNEVISQLDLKYIEAVHSRVEDFARNKEYREKFDVATARAVAQLPIILEYLIPLTKVKGNIICMKGNKIDEEIKKSKKAISVLGGNLEKIDNFYLPDTDIERNIIIVNKVEKTSSKYPRKAGIPSKNPII